MNGGTYTGSLEGTTDLEAANKCIKAVSDGAAVPDLLLHVPNGYGNLSGASVPNVEETEDPARVLAARFAGGREAW